LTQGHCIVVSKRVLADFIQIF